MCLKMATRLPLLAHYMEDNQDINRLLQGCKGYGFKDSWILRRHLTERNTITIIIITAAPVSLTRLLPICMTVLLRRYQSPILCYLSQVTQLHLQTSPQSSKKIDRVLLNLSPGPFTSLNKHLFSNSVYFHRHKSGIPPVR